MNLIDESFEQPEKKGNSKKYAKIILVLIIILVIAAIAIGATIMYMKNAELKIYINGAENIKVKDMMVTDNDGTIYFPIKDISSYIGYESYNGEYSNKSEEANKCYIKSEDEIANFALNSNKIYKLTISDSSANYEYFYSDKPVKAINGKLYASTDAIEKAFNISFTYDTDKQRVYIYTMPYLIERYSSTVLDYGYEAISDNFANKKTVLNNMLVVTKNKGKIYGVIDLKGKDIIESKYDNIEYLPYSGDFLVESNKKVGIISVKRETKIQLLYDSLDLIDSETGLYLAKKDNKYGVIDSKGNIKIYIEYDQIGIDNTKFEQNDIKNKYLLDNGMILARRDKLWGAFDKNGNKVLNFEYDSFGYIASTNKDAINLLIIPDYNVLVASKNKKYVLINSEGEELCKPILDDVYMTINSGKKYYYMNYLNNTGVNVEDFFESTGIKTTSNSSNKKNNTVNNVSDNNGENSINAGNTVDNNIIAENVLKDVVQNTAE